MDGEFFCPVYDQQGDYLGMLRLDPRYMQEVVNSQRPSITIYVSLRPGAARDDEPACFQETFYVERLADGRPALRVSSAIASLPPIGGWLNRDQSPIEELSEWMRRGQSSEV